MKKNIFLITFFLLFFKISFSYAGAGASGMEIDHESFAGGTHGNFSPEFFKDSWGSTRSEVEGISGFEFAREFNISPERSFRMEYSRAMGVGGY